VLESSEQHDTAKYKSLFATTAANGQTDTNRYTKWYHDETEKRKK